MSQRLDNKVGACAPDNLINSPTPAADVFSVTIRKLSAAATLKRGTVLALSASGAAADGNMVILGTEAHKTLTTWSLWPTVPATLTATSSLSRAATP